MAKKYEATNTGEILGGDTEVWSVRVGRSEPVDVWRYLPEGTCRCTQCSGPLSAMLTTCPHAKAVKRAASRLPGTSNLPKEG
jgi:hypothetical protein